jgi:hypothetical protein
VKHCKYLFLSTAIGCLLLAGCDKYLGVAPKGVTLLTTTTNYDQWLNNPSLITGIGATLDLLSDNVDVPTVSNPPTQVSELIYEWQPQYSTDINAAPVFWGTHYANINLFNTVISGVDQATGGTADQIKSLKAEALLGRAFEYFYLLNEYGNAYDSTTAKTDLAVPFVTSNDVSQTLPPRSTIAALCDQIISDVNAAIPGLPVDNSKNRFRGSVAAGYSVLARIYFYARDYADAEKNAELALQNTAASMLDLNGTLPTTSFVTVQQDVIYGRQVLGDETVSLPFMRTFANNDLRVQHFYISSDGYTYMVRGATLFIPVYLTPGLEYVNTGTSVQEMKLIVAECAARANDLPTALQQLDGVRKYRFATASYQPYQSGNPDSVLQQVLLERNHELPFSNLRWFDMRRLDKENRMDTVYRYDAQGNVIATLPPHGDRYTLQIPVQELKFNPGMPQNN